MREILRFIASAIWGTLVCAQTGFAQPIAEKPALAVGDQWRFSSVTEPTGKRDTWSRTVVEIPSAGPVRVRNGNGSIHDYDEAMNYFQKDQVEFPRTLVKYPLKVGEKWKFEVKYTHPNVEEFGDATVINYEELTVPAGTFSCYRVDANSFYAWKHYYSNTRHWTRWYCPKLKWIAKEIVESRIWDVRNPASNGTTIQTSELVRFTPGK